MWHSPSQKISHKLPLTSFLREVCSWRCGFYRLAISSMQSLSAETDVTVSHLTTRSLSYTSIHTQRRRNTQLHYVIDSLLHNRLSLTPALNYSDSQLGGFKLLNSFQSLLTKAQFTPDWILHVLGTIRKMNQFVKWLHMHVCLLFIYLKLI